MEIGQEVLAEILVIAVQGLEGEDAGDDEEDIGIGTFHHLTEAIVLLRNALYSPREVQQMSLLLAVAEIVASLLPTPLVLYQ